LTRIGVKAIAERPTVVTNQFTITARWKTSRIAGTEFTTRFIVTNVDVGIKKVKDDTCIVRLLRLLWLVASSYCGGRYVEQ
jgi:hypothetical protein